ncbi:hypothetical protein Poli38472_007352 [Pythium oligandrum]|uniref:Transmembrane protein n=1 Tax=Pythium oligandrum TaxID=41045 RepID=A0A8K1FGZ0_PYTOL|nr:hypothetical protein Poli38472_007352 [Pythium oligandrum]|eukprot:TMW59207.1 hypothetical protein Poli38472_007352 [Pythium oligandrum]
MAHHPQPQRDADYESELGTPPGYPTQPEQFQKLKTPYDVGLQDGALREGGAPSLFTRDYIGLLFQYAAVGLIDGVLPSTIYPFLQVYLNVPGHMSATAMTLVRLPWSFKVFYGTLSDCLPIRGYRRRPYMMLGWSIAVAMLLVMGTTPQGQPYYTNPAYRHVPPEKYTAEIEATLNRDAPHSGALYVVLMMLCAFGYLLADVCADGIVVELAQREPLAVRGRTQSMIYTTRTIFNIIALVVNAFAFNGAEYGGEFNFSLSFPTLMLILAFCLMPLIPISWLFIREDRVSRVHFHSYMMQLWEIIQTRAVYQVIAYNFLQGVFWNFSYTSVYPIQEYWAKVTPLNEKVMGLLANGIFAGAILVTGRYGLHWNWRTIPIITSVVIIALDSVCTMLTVWGVVRNQWFWLGIPVLEQLPNGLNFIVSTFVVVELAVEGHEGSMYGLLTTVSNLTGPFANSLTIVANSHWDLSNDRLQNDTFDVRRDVTITIWLRYLINLGSLVWLFLIPRQKEETQMLKRIGGSSRFMGILTVCYLVFALLWSVTTNVLAIFPNTACLAIAGGTGC